jgi:hypothetical protein
MMDDCSENEVAKLLAHPKVRDALKANLTTIAPQAGDKITDLMAVWDSLLKRRFQHVATAVKAAEPTTVDLLIEKVTKSPEALIVDHYQMQSVKEYNPQDYTAKGVLKKGAQGKVTTRVVRPCVIQKAQTLDSVLLNSEQPVLRQLAKVIDEAPKGIANSVRSLNTPKERLELVAQSVKDLYTLSSVANGIIKRRLREIKSACFAKAKQEAIEKKAPIRDIFNPVFWNHECGSWKAKFDEDENAPAFVEEFADKVGSDLCKRYCHNLKEIMATFEDDPTKAESTSDKSSRG